jgi:hypothetical protein
VSKAGGHYPIRYRAADKARLSHAFSMILMALLVGGFFGFVVFSSDVLWVSVLMGVCALGGAACCIWDALDVLTRETTFLRDEVIVSNFRGQQRFARSDLSAWNWGQKRAGMQEVELYSEGAKMPFRVQVALPVDATLQTWFGEVTSLEWREQSGVLDEVEADAAFGDTPQDRLHNAAREGRTAAWIGWAAVAPAAWAFFYPSPYRVAVGMAIAAPVLLALLTILRRDQWQFERSSRDPRPTTGWAIFICVMILALRAFLDWQVIDWVMLAALSIAGGAVIGVLLRMLLREESPDRWSTIAWIIAASLYAYGALTPLNMWLDRAGPESYRAVVLETYGESVRVSAWGPYDAPQEHDANAWLLDRVEQGGPICADLYRGAFGIRSFDLKPCPAQ